MCPTGLKHAHSFCNPSLVSRGLCSQSEGRELSWNLLSQKGGFYSLGDSDVVLGAVVNLCCSGSKSVQPLLDL